MLKKLAVLAFVLAAFSGVQAHADDYISVSSCGTSPTIWDHSDENHGQVTIGTGLLVTGCTITFDQAKTSASFVVCNVQSTNILPIGVTINGEPGAWTGFTVNTTLQLGGATLGYTCVGG